MPGHDCRDRRTTRGVISVVKRREILLDRNWPRPPSLRAQTQSTEVPCRPQTRSPCRDAPGGNQTPALNAAGVQLFLRQRIACDASSECGIREFSIGQRIACDTCSTLCADLFCAWHDKCAAIRYEMTMELGRTRADPRLSGNVTGGSTSSSPVVSLTASTRRWLPRKNSGRP